MHDFAKAESLKAVFEAAIHAKQCTGMDDVSRRVRKELPALVAAFNDVVKALVEDAAECAGERIVFGDSFELGAPDAIDDAFGAGFWQTLYRWDEEQSNPYGYDVAAEHGHLGRHAA